MSSQSAEMANGDGDGDGMAFKASSNSSCLLTVDSLFYLFLLCVIAIAIALSVVALLRSQIPYFIILHQSFLVEMSLHLSGRVAIIGGSSFLDTDAAVELKRNSQNRVVETPYGSVSLMVLPVSHQSINELVYVQRHQSDPSVAYSQPHRINKKAIFHALRYELVSFG